MKLRKNDYDRSLVSEQIPLPAILSALSSKWRVFGNKEKNKREKKKKGTTTAQFIGISEYLVVRRSH